MRYSLAHADIAHQRVEDEVIVVNLRTGAYFSLRHAAADAWDLLSAGIEPDGAAAIVAGRYGAEAAAVAGDLAALAERLLAEDLLAEDLLAAGPLAAGPDGATATTDQAAGADAVELPAVAAGVAYAAPTLDKYDDMEELLLLDPIHEVDEAGWPIVASEPTE